MSTVPCEGCRACCQRQMVLLMPEDQPNREFYDYHEIEGPNGPIRALKSKANGDCIHLGPEGCTIYDRRPAICQAYDCRRQFLSLTRDERRQTKNRQIWKEARARLATLTGDERAEVAEYRELSRQSFRRVMERLNG